MDLSAQFFKIAKTLINEEIKTVKNEGGNEFDSFTKTLIYKIGKLKRVMVESREKYFASSTFLKGAFSEQQKDEFDQNVLEILKECETMLKQVKEIHKPTSNKTEYAHREIAVSCLYKRVQEVSLLFKEFKTFRFQEIHRVNDLINLNPVKTMPSKHSKAKVTEVIESEELSRQNKMLLCHFENDVEKVKEAQKRLYDLSQLINTFSNKIVEQDLTTESIMDNAMKSVNYVEEANKHLIDANKYSQEFGKRWALCFFVMGVILLVFDYIWP